MKFINKQFVKPAMYGLIVGDALGVPYEFNMRDTFKIDGMTGFGTHHQPLGTWSDDSSMALATIDGFLNSDKIDYTLIMRNFSDWFHHGAYTPFGECFDIGHTTANAIARFDDGRKPVTCGGKGFNDNGNGSLMRILPIAFVEHSVQDILNLSALTHAHEISMMCCRLYIQLAENLMNGMPKDEAIVRLTCCVDECERIPVIKDCTRKQISSSGYVVDTFEAAVWCFMNTASYRECLVTAVELGNDTDTVGAVVGGLAGIYYGIGGDKGIPEEWIASLVKKEWIDEMLGKVISR